MQKGIPNNNTAAPKSLEELMEEYCSQNGFSAEEEAFAYDWYQKAPSSSGNSSDGCCCCNAMGVSSDDQFECCCYTCLLSCVSI